MVQINILTNGFYLGIFNNSSLISKAFLEITLTYPLIIFFYLLFFLQNSTLEL